MPRPPGKQRQKLKPADYMKCCEHYAKALRAVRDESHVGSRIWRLANDALTSNLKRIAAVAQPGRAAAL